MAKNGGKTFLAKSARYLCIAGTKNFVEISHRFHDKCIFEFYAEIQDGRQKWEENDFGAM